MFFYLIHWWGEIFFRGGTPLENKKNYVFNEAASKDYVCINQRTKPGLFLIIPDHSRQFPTIPNYPIPPETMFNHYLL